MGVRTDLSVRPHGLLVEMDELAQILDGDDVPGVVLVDVIDDAGQCGRLTRSGWTRDEHQPLFQVTERFNGCGELQIFESQNILGNDTEHRARSVFLHEVVGTKARNALEAVRKVQISARQIILPVRVCRNLASEIAK